MSKPTSFERPAIKGALISVMRAITSPRHVMSGIIDTIAP
jgi:hypothetical protein